jgi:hypothetical protein
LNGFVEGSDRIQILGKTRKHTKRENEQSKQKNEKKKDGKENRKEEQTFDFCFGRVLAESASSRWSRTACSRVTGGFLVVVVDVVIGCFVGSDTETKREAK